MNRRIAIALALFALATVLTARMGDWIAVSLVAPLCAVVIVGVGAALIAMAPPPQKELDEAAITGPQLMPLEMTEST